VDFGFNDEQEMLRRSVADFCEKECGAEFLFEMWEDDKGYSSDMWRKMADLGWLGLLFDEKYGGMGLGFVDLCVILEEMGKALLPAPYISTLVLFGQCILHSGNDEQKKRILPAVAGGDLIGTFALVEESGGLAPEDINMKAEAQADGYVLNGTKLLVPDARAASAIIVAARTKTHDDPADGVTLFMVDAGTPGISIKPLKTMDMLRRLAEVEFSSVEVEKDRILGKIDRGWPIVQAVTRAACAALSVEMVGVAQKALDLSVDYAKVRQQFGAPIGSFQAVKHKCAEMLLQLETARSAAYYAAWTVGERAPDLAVATSVAKAWCGEACRRIAADAVQVHGGIGFTWEYPLHMYFKRAQACDAAFGNAARHREMIMRRIESS
jgi:alkylation response protein AidB-like acyl-CoA dehydrogenase